MSEETSDIERMYKAVQSFRELGTGRNRQGVLLGDSDDARTARLFFKGEIYHNWPSWNTIQIKGKDRSIRTFNTAGCTVYGKPAFIFRWNELTADLWFRQMERDKLLKWLETARPSDLVAMAVLIAEQTESKHRPFAYPGFERSNLRWMQIEIRKLSLSVLIKLNSLTAGQTAADGAESRMAA